MTGLNCPPSFGNEYNYDDYLKTHDDIVPKFFDSHAPSANSHTYNYKITHDHHDHDHDHVVCDELGNCGPLGYPHDHDQHLHLPHNPLYHNHDHPHDHLHPHPVHEMPVPFFPQSNTNQQDYNYSTGKVTTPRPRKAVSSCGMLPRNAGNIEVFPWITRLAYLNTSK